MSPVEEMIRSLTKGGSRAAARRLVTRALKELAALGSLPPEVFLSEAIDNAMPVIEIVPRVIEGLTYRVPRPVPAARRRAKGVQRIVALARRLAGRLTAQSLAKAIKVFFTNAEPEPDPDRPTQGALRLPTKGAYRTG